MCSHIQAMSAFFVYIIIIYLFTVQNSLFLEHHPLFLQRRKIPNFETNPSQQNGLILVTKQAENWGEKKSQFWSTQPEANWNIHPQGRLFGHLLLGSPDNVCRTDYLPVDPFSSSKRHCSKSLKTQLPLSRFSPALKSRRIPKLIFMESLEAAEKESTWRGNQSKDQRENLEGKLPWKFRAGETSRAFGTKGIWELGIKGWNGRVFTVERQWNAKSLGKKGNLLWF